MLRTTLLLASAVAALGASPPGPQLWEFEPLPAAVDGIPIAGPIAIANDGAVLLWLPTPGRARRYSIYRNGRLDPFELVPGAPLDQVLVTLTDFNTRHEIVGNSWFVRVPYSGYVGRGFLRNRSGDLELFAAPWESSGLNSINEHAVAVGFLRRPRGDPWCGMFSCFAAEQTTAMVMVDGAAVPLQVPGAGAVDDTTALAIDDAGRILAHRGGTPSFLLLDGERFEVISPPPDVPDPGTFEMLDLNNRGQILGRWLDPAIGWRAFLRERDGTFAPIEWDSVRPEAIQRQAPTGEMVSLQLTRTGMFVYRF